MHGASVARSFAWPRSSAADRPAVSSFVGGGPWHSCMDRTTELHYLISGNNQFGRVKLSRAAAGRPSRRQRELLQEAILM
jgi:hypothetical protein